MEGLKRVREAGDEEKRGDKDNEGTEGKRTTKLNEGRKNVQHRRRWKRSILANTSPKLLGYDLNVLDSTANELLGKICRKRID